MTPTCFSDVLKTLPHNHPVKKAHAAWSKVFNQITDGNPILALSADAEQTRHLLLVTTRLRSAIEDSHIASIPIVQTYCRLLEADTQIMKVTQ